MKVAYLVMTDLHLDFSKANRVNYFGEILQSMSDILEIADKYKKQGYSVNLCMLGDVFDGSLPNASEAMQAIEVFRYFCSNFTHVWSVVGNHEITYAKDNPFWFLISEIADESLNSIKRFIQPRGLCETILVPETVVDGEVTFYFNHFGTSPKTPVARGVRIGLFHQNVGSNDICKMWGTFDKVDDAAYVQGYQHCFFGHMHMAKGKYYLNKEHTCQGEWLGTIGRTKVDEVSTEDLQVNIPVVKVEDGVFRGIDDNTIELQPPALCIDFERLRASQRSRKVIEERRQAIPGGFKGETLFATLEGVFVDTPMGFLLDFLDRPWEEVLHAYNETLRNPGENTEEEEESEQ